MLSQINLPQILQSIESYDGDSNSDYFLLTVLDRLIVMYIALFKTNFYCILYCFRNSFTELCSVFVNTIEK